MFIYIYHYTLYSCGNRRERRTAIRARQFGVSQPYRASPFRTPIGAGSDKGARVCRGSCHHSNQTRMSLPSNYRQVAMMGPTPTPGATRKSSLAFLVYLPLVWHLLFHYYTTGCISCGRRWPYTCSERHHAVLASLLTINGGKSDPENRTTAFL